MYQWISCSFILLIITSDVSQSCFFKSDLISNNTLLMKWPGFCFGARWWFWVIQPPTGCISSNGQNIFSHWTSSNEVKVIISLDKDSFFVVQNKTVSCCLFLWKSSVKSNISTPAKCSLVPSRCDVTNRGTLSVCSHNNCIIIPLYKCCVTLWIRRLSYMVLHASISSENTEVHPVPNKSPSTAFLPYTSRHLACNLAVCWGDMRPPNDLKRRHACNCSGWRNDANDSVFQYLFIHTLKWEGVWGVLHVLLGRSSGKHHTCICIFVGWGFKRICFHYSILKCVFK